MKCKLRDLTTGTFIKLAGDEKREFERSIKNDQEQILTSNNLPNDNIILIYI